MPIVAETAAAASGPHLHLVAKRPTPLSFVHAYIVKHPTHHSARAKLLAFTIAGHAFNPATPDEAFPGVDLLARETGASERTTQRALRELVDGPYPLFSTRWENGRRIFRVVRHPEAFAKDRDAKRAELVAQARARRKSSEVVAAISTTAAAAQLGKLSQADAAAIIKAAEKTARGKVPQHALRAADHPQPAGCALWSSILQDTGNRVELAKSAYVAQLRRAATGEADQLIPHIRGCSTCGKLYTDLREKLVAAVDLSFAVRQAACSS